LLLLPALSACHFKNNVEYGRGTYYGSKYTLNFQPVIPISLSPDLNLVTRYVVPIVDQHLIAGEGEDEFGLCDATISGFSHLRYM